MMKLTNLRTHSRTSFNLEDKLGGESKDELEDKLEDELENELKDELEDNLEDADGINFSAMLRLRTLVEVAYFGGHTDVFSY